MKANVRTACWRPRLAMRRAIPVITALAMAALATGAPSSCSVSEPGPDMMSCTGVQRSLMQTDFKRSPQFDRGGVAGSWYGEEVASLSSAAAAANATLDTNVHEPSAVVDTKAQDTDLSAVGGHRQAVAEGIRGETGLSEVAKSLMHESNATVQDGDSAIVMSDAGAYAQQPPQAIAHVLLSDLAYGRSTSGILLQAATSKSMLPYILVASLVLMVLFISVLFGHSFMSEQDAPRPTPRQTHSFPQAPRFGSAVALRNSPKQWSAGELSSPALRVPRGEGNDVMDRLVAPVSPPPPLSPTATSLALPLPQPHQPSIPSVKGGQLCPGLVVPHGQDCVLAVREYASAAAGRYAAGDAELVVLDVLDMHGNTVLKAHVAPPPPALAPPSFMRLLTPSGGSQGVVGNANLLCECRFDGVGGLNIYNGEGEFFGVFLRDMARPRYSFVGNSVGPSVLRMYFDVVSQDTMIVTSETGEHLADTEPITVSFDLQGKFGKVRVVSGVDAGLVLSGVFAIEAMESAPAQL